MWRKFSDVWYLLTFNFICLLLQYKSKVSSWRSLQFDQGCALEAWTPLGLKMWRRKRNGRADFFRLESVRGLVRCEEKLKLRRKLRLTAPWPPDPLLKISQLLFSTGWAFHQQNPRKYLKNPPVGLMSPHITWRVHFQRIKVLNLFKMFRISKDKAVVNCDSCDSVRPCPGCRAESERWTNDQTVKWPLQAAPPSEPPLLLWTQCNIVFTSVWSSGSSVFFRVLLCCV